MWLVSRSGGCVVKSLFFSRYMDGAGMVNTYMVLCVFFWMPCWCKHFSSVDIAIHRRNQRCVKTRIPLQDPQPYSSERRSRKTRRHVGIHGGIGKWRKTHSKCLTYLMGSTLLRCSRLLLFLGSSSHLGRCVSDRWGWRRRWFLHDGIWLVVEGVRKPRFFRLGLMDAAKCSRCLQG